MDEIVEIASRVDSSWEFVIIGDGDKFDSICELIKKKKTSNVKMLGSMKNEEALKYLLDSSIFIMTSETEGLPMVLLEAFSHGVPAVCYQTDSGVSDIVDDDLNGFVIENRNQAEMIDKLSKLMNDYKLRKNFGKETPEEINEIITSEYKNKS